MSSVLQRRRFLTLPADTPPPEIPYPGLRPFEEHEADIFIGRSEPVLELVHKLRHQRYLAIVGPSGCGKSSLVRSGLLPALQSGLVFRDGRTWHAALFRPGQHPVANLATALLESGALSDPLPDPAQDLDEVERRRDAGMLFATLRRSSLGLIRLLEQRPLRPQTNLLLLVDQFEELFRYGEHSDEADALVALLLESIRQAKESPDDLPIYVGLTMRSDFIGDCNRFPGLAEAISNSQFLTPRMTRDQRRAAIVGPAFAFGGRVDEELVNRLLNDMGEDHDQLPIMQHALMRMWLEVTDRQRPEQSINEAIVRRSPERKTANLATDLLSPTGEVGVEENPLDARTEITLTVEDYEQVGGWRRAISQHGNEVYQDLGSPRRQQIAEALFRRLTDHQTHRRDLRRPATFGEVARVAQLRSPEEKKELQEVIERFSEPDCCFLTPRLGTNLTDDTLLDLGHESLIRQWDQLHEWSLKEAEAVKEYRRIGEDAERFRGREAEWRGLNLEKALAWRRENSPTAAWAERYGGDFFASMQFLDTCQKLDRKSRRKAVALYLSGTLLLAALAVLATLWVGHERARADVSNSLQIEAELVGALEKWSTGNRDGANLQVRNAINFWNGIHNPAIKTESGMRLIDQLLKCSFNTVYGEKRVQSNTDSKHLYDMMDLVDSLLVQMDSIDGISLRQTQAALLRNGITIDDYARNATGQGMNVAGNTSLRNRQNHFLSLLRNLANQPKKNRDSSDSIGPWLVASHYDLGRLGTSESPEELNKAYCIYADLNKAKADQVPRRLYANLCERLAIAEQCAQRMSDAANVYMQIGEYKQAAVAYYNAGELAGVDNDEKLAYTAKAAAVWFVYDRQIDPDDDNQVKAQIYAYRTLQDSVTFYEQAIELLSGMESPPPDLVGDIYGDYAETHWRYAFRKMTGEAKDQVEFLCWVRKCFCTLDKGVVCLKKMPPAPEVDNQIERLKGYSNQVIEHVPDDLKATLKKEHPNFFENNEHP